MDPASASAQPYRVLARTYRPQRLSELIGQDALVRTLTNAMASGRIAHAFLLAGIRGIGKTTTARIIAKGLNCTGQDGQGGPTPEPCGICPSCRSLVEERPMDVIEMDAATRTGIDDIREIVDAVRYAPAASRYKVYIIDEVHMLSEKAFNGLLKTLEEPPPHAKFIFATTEVRKLPVTVLSRCQRFDLKRVEALVLEAHLARIATKESVTVEPEALALLARAAEGSVRDALSLLDQAIALSDGPVTTSAVAGMLGLGDRQLLIDLFADVIGGKAAAGLDRSRELYRLGAEPTAVLLDLLEIAHWLSCSKIDRYAGSAFATTPEAVAAGQALAEKLDLAVLARAWQVLMKGLDEVRAAPDAAQALEMVLLRLAAMGPLPTPGEVLDALGRAEARTSGNGGAPASGSRPQAPTRPPAPPPMARIAPLEPRREETRTSSDGGQRPVPDQRSPARHAPDAGSSAHRPKAGQLAARAPTEPADFADLVRLLHRRGQPLLASYLKEGAHLIGFQKDRIELRLAPGLPRDISGKLSEALLEMTGRRWLIALSQNGGAASLAEQEADERQRLIQAVAEDAAVREVLDAFPGATIVDIRDARRHEGLDAAAPEQDAAAALGYTDPDEALPVGLAEDDAPDLVFTDDEPDDDDDPTDSETSPAAGANSRMER
jgi:DNA polymerase III subunit gamma/tau